MHPIERLRYVARSSGAPQDLLVRETALALSSFRDDHSGLVTACRRIVGRQLSAGAIWWLCSRMLCAADPMTEATAAVEEIESDRTPSRIAAVLDGDTTVAVLGWPALIGSGLARRGDLDVLVVDALGEASSFVRFLGGRDVDATEVPESGLGAAVLDSSAVLLEASAVGPEGFVAIAGSRAAAAVARHAGVDVVLVAGVGRVLPGRVWEAMAQRLTASSDPFDAPDEVVPLDLVDRVIGPNGVEDLSETLVRADCPIAPELFKADIT